MQLKITVHGTQDGDKNAQPKAKLTKGQQWTPKAHKYAAWKRHVQEAFFKATKPRSDELKRQAHEAIISHYPPEITGRKPITIQPGNWAHMELHIDFNSAKHADPENIFGSIADALFTNDNRLSGLFLFRENQPTAKVEILIEINNQQKTWTTS